MNNKKPARRMDNVQASKMSRLLGEAKRLKAQGAEIIDLALGTPDYAAPSWLLSVAQEKIAAGFNGYGDSKGSIRLRHAISCNFQQTQGVSYEPENEVTITSGASSALSAVVHALLNPRDGVLVFEPYYENFIPLLRFAGVTPQFVSLDPVDWSIDFAKLEKRIRPNTRAILINSPHNPTGRVFTPVELQVLAAFCQKHDLIAISDEAYGPFTYEQPHLSIAAVEGMKDRTVVLTSVSKTLNVAGWRVGSVLAPAHLSDPIRRANGITMGAPTPLQEACADAFPYIEAFCQEQRRSHQVLRAELGEALASAGMSFQLPQGTFSVLAALPAGSFADGDSAQAELLRRAGILTVSGDSFFNKKPSTAYLRFSFARSPETIRAAARQLSNIKLG